MKKIVFLTKHLYKLLIFLMKCNILLITFTESETRGLFARFSNIQTKLINNYNYNYLGVINGQHLCHTISEMNSDGPGGSLQTTERAINAVNPSAVIGLGIAFGLDTKLKLGDILISTRIIPYDFGKITKDSDFINRADHPLASSELLNYFRNAYVQQTNYTAKFCALITGQKLVDNHQVWEQLQTDYPEVCGGEMEARGFTTSCNSHRLPWIILKAISDWGDGTKSMVNRTFVQNLAMSNVVGFFFDTLAKYEFPFSLD